MGIGRRQGNNELMKDFSTTRFRKMIIVLSFEVKGPDRRKRKSPCGLGRFKGIQHRPRGRHDQSQSALLKGNCCNQANTQNSLTG